MKKLTEKQLAYIAKYELDKLLSIKKVVSPPDYKTFDTVDPSYKDLFYVDWSDLISLHQNIINHKIINVLEYGIGYSTLVMAHALSINEKKYKKKVSSDFRKTMLFKCVSLDNDKKYVNFYKKKIINMNKVNKNLVLSHSPTYVTQINNKICTLHKKIPNFSPDFIYLDGPSNYNHTGDINGFNFLGVDKVPNAADILLLEYALMPGCKIIIDGRKTNGRFLKNNLQRTWSYREDEVNDKCILILDEKPIGKYNSAQMNFQKTTK
jgi:hypothetical protein